MPETPFRTAADAAGILPLPTASTDDRAAVAVELLTVGPPAHDEAHRLVVPLWDACLDGEPKGLAPALVAQLAEIARLPGLAFTIALHTAFGRRVAEESVLEFFRLVSRSSRRGQCIDDYVDDLVAADAVPHGTLVRLLHGEARRVPATQRVRRGIALLRRIASLVPLAFVPPLLCIIAWLHWTQGKRTIALAYLHEASAIFPDDVLAYGLTWLVSTKTPVWLTKAPS